MRYFVLIPDGMADWKSEALGGRTPMEAAEKPTMDRLCQQSRCGTVLNVPKGMVPESDTANLSILSYDPRVYSKGRSPLEAVSMGLTLSPDDTAIRCNLVTLSEEDGVPYEERLILDHSADEITTAEADELVKALNNALPMEGRRLYTGVSYRHCLIWRNADETYDFMRPHDILGKAIGPYLPREDNGGAPFLAYMKAGFEALNHHPVNEARRARGLRPANAPWLWSPGRKPSLPDFTERWGVRAAIISAVDLIKGIGRCAGCCVIDVPGATGNLATNYAGKAQAAMDAFAAGYDFVYVHVEAPDECGHRGEYEGKTAAIEKIDRLILAPVLRYLRGDGEPFRILVLPDHPTPCAIRTHAPEPVPFFLYSSERTESGVPAFTEELCAKTGDHLPDGCGLLPALIF